MDSTVSVQQQFSHRMVKHKPGELLEETYTVKDPLGSGRFGKVWLVEDQKTGDKFAAKQCACRRASQRKEFELEIEIMNSLDHPKLLQLYDAFFGKNDVTLILELVTGGELFDRIADEAFDLTEALAVKYIRQICEAVQYMHGNMILHLDIKPENILCVSPERLDSIKIIDFGFARKYTPNSPLKIMFGTPEFVAPEVVNFDPLGKGTDMWSIGVVTYVLLSGLSPFMGEDEQETLSNVTACDVDFDDDSFDDVSDDAKTFITKLLDIRESKRPNCAECLEHSWLSKEDQHRKSLSAAVVNLKKFVARRKWVRSINAVRAMTRLQAGLKKNDDPSTSK
uniref:Myosin light chain kinase, smooth muscle-like n=1 Tax=Ciona intestinalis TaxID=7719 RepID=A0A1W5BFH2_CIOIN|nr:myosin light chain kinase, smooth muscle-like [Ciona intestinalis]XP_026691795.1 myosin light chain kinase, smooth muscle-like [Ciona intestinalis]|eukprot:XP_026691794.1 myosin light chain kinase, smooth muscle-like [Ciona intestinalis]